MATLSEENLKYILDGMDFCERQAEFLHDQIRHYKVMLQKYAEAGSIDA